jgi:hypothetical protein
MSACCARLERAELEAVPETDAAEAEPAVDLPRTARRASRAEADAATTRRVGESLEGVCADFFSLVEALQAQARDTQASCQEREASARSSGARDAHDRRVGELERAVSDRAHAAESSNVADILRWVGVGLSLVVGAVGAIFSGGATLVAAIAVAVALVATTTLQALGQAGVIGQDAAAIASVVVSAVATVVSFGASVGSLVSAASTAATTAASSVVSAGTTAVTAAATGASAGASAASAATDILQQIPSILQGLAAITQGSYEIDASVATRDSAQHEASAAEHGHRRDAEAELRDEAVDVLSSLMRSFARVAASMADAREESSSAARAALVHIG